MTTGTWDRHRGHASDYDVVEAGWNFRPQEISAALGHAGLAELGWQNQARRRALERYRTAFAGTPVTMVHTPGEASTGHIAVAVLPPGTRRTVRAALTAEGIQSSFHYPPIHRFAAYRDIAERPLPATEAAADSLVTLPLHPWLDADTITAIAGTVVDQLG